MASLAGTVRSDSSDLLEVHPLGEAQRGLWFAQALDPVNPVFNTGQVMEICGALDVERFARAVAKLHKEADSLSLRILDDNRQVRDPGEEPPLSIVDLSQEADPAAIARSDIRRDMETPLDLARQSPALFRLYRFGDDRFWWYVRLHHVVADGFATHLILSRTAELYNRGAADAGPALSPLEIALEQDRLYGGSPQHAEDRAFWVDALKDMPEVAGIKQGPALTARSYHHEVQAVPVALTERLRELSMVLKLGWSDIVTALVAAYYARFVGQQDVTVGVAFMGRFGSPAARVPLMLMNILPVRLRIDEDQPFCDWLVAAAATLAVARRHGRYRHEHIRRDLGLGGGQRRLFGPLVNVLPYEGDLRLEGTTVTTERLGTGPVDDITFSFRGDPMRTNLTVEIDANPGLYGTVELRAHAERFLHFLDRSVASALADGTLADVPTVTDTEAAWLIGTLNETGHVVEPVTLVEVIDEAFADHAGRVAVRFGDETLSYAELDRRSAALARQLIAAGAGRDRRIAVALPRSTELLIGLVAILRSGAAYMPVDLSHPAERIERMLARGTPVLALAPDGVLIGDVPVLAPSTWETKPSGDALPAVGPHDAAYVIFTSGSTGEPKGVLVEHRAIVNRLEWMKTHYGFSADDVILQKTPMTFDVSVWEFFLSFFAGGTLVMAPPEAHKDPEWLARLIRENGVTTAHFVPSMLSAFVSEPKARGLSLRRVFASGEELTADLRDRFHREISAELHNLYGPTEAAVDVSYWAASPDDGSNPVPIGLPVWNTRLYVLDGRLRPVPPGVAGRLYIAGVQLAREYVGRPDLTAERFVMDPFHKGERMYDTGDLARLRPDGAIDYLGRLDNQIKLRGLRIELGEIEAAILSYPHVTQSVVILHQAGPEKRIVGYYVASPAVEEPALRRHLERHLPDYMVPSLLVCLPAMPLSSNGKLDRNALPAPRFSAGRGEPPLPGTEQIVADLFASLLEPGEPISRDDDFFALGGHSLLAVLAVQQLGRLFGRDIGLGTLFRYPTVKRLAAHLDGEARADDNGLQPVIKLNATDNDAPPLFMIHPAGGIGWCYGGYARALAGERAVWSIQAEALDPGRPEPESLQAMALAYARRIGEVAGARPVHLCGWSVGGIIAHAVANALVRSGRSVGCLVMLDSYPADCWRNEPDPGPDAGLKALLAIAGHDPDRLLDLPMTRDAVRDFLRRKESPLAALPETAFEGIMRVVCGNNRLVREHVHESYPGTILHVAAAPSGNRRLSPADWRAYAGAVREHRVPFIHAELTSPPAVEAIAPLLAAEMAAREDRGCN
ncbi:amino acid adenylation domain-containing protein [Ciceribacter sp. RN22]|uniref:amino acid adenylation domain-containing protein n=1 Tax=Ciceribacter sp. RN22 TaxID=2954932 RepID=UPI0020934844|nr:amino acid adenylation domain-containing protein [Ciceribacter sp. RN22]MCO6179730.1 amino acid adenylation domain-containing protein [Ciceribacter sp. RN22]